VTWSSQSLNSPNKHAGPRPKGDSSLAAPPTEAERGQEEEAEDRHHDPPPRLARLSPPPQSPPLGPRLHHLMITREGLGR
jgi:hypothetical protein